MTHADRGERSDRPDLGATDPGPGLGSDHEELSSGAVDPAAHPR